MYERSFYRGIIPNTGEVLSLLFKGVVLGLALCSSIPLEVLESGKIGNGIRRGMNLASLWDEELLSVPCFYVHIIGSLLLVC